MLPQIKLENSRAIDIRWGLLQRTRRLLRAIRKPSKSFKKPSKSRFKEPQKNELWKAFFGAQGSNENEFQSLMNRCQRLATDINDNNESAKTAKLWEVLVEVRKIGDAAVSAAPETVSLVWFGISSLISITAKSQELRNMMCDTCQSIAVMIRDCLRWEKHTLDSPTAKSAHKTQSLGLSEIDIWQVEVPELFYAILDFLWHSLAHRDQTFFRRIGSTVKETFTNNLKQKVERLMETYNKLVQSAQAQFEDLLLARGQEAGRSLAETKKVMEESVTLLSQIFENLHYEWKRSRLKEQIEEIAEPTAHKLHFGGLNDRVNTILNERENGEVAEWFFNNDSYQSWEGACVPGSLEIERKTLLCLRGRRGHGKSMAMLCLRKRLEQGTNGLVQSDHLKSTVLYFFFKRGDMDLQNTRTALETILHQLLNRVQDIVNNGNILDDCVSVLNPELGQPNETGQSAGSKYDSTDIKSISETIRRIASRLPRVYILVDALDECNDRQERGLVPLLKSIAGSSRGAINESIRIIFSVRNTVDIMAELRPSAPLPQEPESSSTSNPIPGASEDLEPWIGMIEITAEKNSSDLKAYLEHDVKALLTRRINPDTHPKFYNSELMRISGIIRERANGDFALARMFIAHLQQPSKLPLNEKELYRSAKDRSWNSGLGSDPNRTQTDVASLTFPNSTDTISNSVSGSGGIIEDDPEDDPEVKNIIFHLETVGQDFFKIKKHTNLIDVDISIREWIQDEHGAASSGVKERGGFSRYMDDGKNIVFKFTLTPSFVRYGSGLSELFSERKAQMSITLDILRALNNPSFQNKHMPWNFEQRAGTTHRRYEIENWHSHLKILDKWWVSDKSLYENKWSDIREQISIFMQPNNWYRWAVLHKSKVPFTTSNQERDLGIVSRLCQHPIHVAAAYGLRIVIDILLDVDGNTKLAKARPQERFDAISASIWKIATEEEVRHFKTHQKDIRNIPEADVPLENGVVPLFLAAAYPEALQCLIKHGANVNAVIRKGAHRGGPILLFMLSEIACNRHPNMVISTWIESAKILISRGARVDVPDKSGSTALHYAAKIQDVEFFRFVLVSANQDVHVRNEVQQTPLHYLFSRHPITSKVQDTLQICDILVSMSRGGGEGEDLVNAQDRHSTSPLFGAIGQGFIAGVKKLIELGVDVHGDDNSGSTCFHRLAIVQASDSTLEIAELLYKQGLDFKRKDNAGRTALLNALRYENEIMTGFLLEKYKLLDIDEAQLHPILVSDSDGETILHSLARDTTEWSEAIFKSIVSWLDNAAIREALAKPGSYGDTPLYIAAKEVNMRQINGFLELEPDINVRNWDGETILDLWCAETSGVSHRRWEHLEPVFFSTLKRIFDATSPPFRLSILEALIWGDNNQLIMEKLGWRLFEEREEFRDPKEYHDEHNWTVQDILKFCPGDVSRMLQKLGDPLGSRNILSPSRMNFYTISSLEGSEDGLSCCLIRTTGFSLRSEVSADHPIPPDYTFYFEVTFLPAMESWKEDIGSCRIGVLTRGSYKKVERHAAIGHLGKGLRFGDGKSDKPLDIKEDLPLVSNLDPRDESETTQSRIPSVTLGLGINTALFKVFITFNGQIALQAEDVPQRRYFPSATLSTTCPRCTLNFGKTPFRFEPANDVGWRGDVSLVQSLFGQ
ncbi:hypothetical protein TWF506_011240 [Arthrobotrys conoides]|uniref:Nephrocystin 3-like N-terminal domain-containing protein n=1 Tax=Arthrobotrys conoides TaxID=74498 RepID=A0AAN8NJF2_9PEZI